PKRLVDPRDDSFVWSDVGQRTVRAWSEDAVHERTSRVAVSIRLAAAHRYDGDIAPVCNSEDMISTLQCGVEEVSTGIDRQLGRKRARPIKQEDERHYSRPRWLQRVVHATGVLTGRTRARGRGREHPAGSRTGNPA